MNDDHFLADAKQRIKSLEKKQLYVFLMTDEIHLKEYFIYKGRILLALHMMVLNVNLVHIYLCCKAFFQNSKMSFIFYLLKMGLVMFFFQY